MNEKLQVVQCMVHNSTRYVCFCIPNFEFRFTVGDEKVDRIEKPEIIHGVQYTKVISLD